MAKYIYPAVFREENGIYAIRFPDLDGCYTQGDDIQDAYEMAEDVLCLTLYGLEEGKRPIPRASEISDIAVAKWEFTSLVTCDTLEYRKFYDNRAVKKTLTIPAWLNTMSEREGINFSAVLQAALKDELHITEN